MLDMTKVRAASGCEDTIPVPKPSLWRKWAQTQKEHMGKVKADKKKKKKDCITLRGFWRANSMRRRQTPRAGPANQMPQQQP